MIVPGHRESWTLKGMDIPTNADGSVDALVDGETVRVEELEWHRLAGFGSFLSMQGRGGNYEMFTGATSIEFVGEERLLSFEVQIDQIENSVEFDGQHTWDVSYVVQSMASLKLHDEPEPVSDEPDSTPDESKALSVYLANE